MPWREHRAPDHPQSRGKNERFHRARAQGVQGRTLLVLDKLGVAEPMLGAAKHPTRVLREYFGSRLVTEIDFANICRGPFSELLPIFQQQVVRFLEAALADSGRRVEWSIRLMALAIDENSVIARARRSPTHRPHGLW